jgi:hypothetical protein
MVNRCSGLWRCCGISPEQLNPALHAAAAALNEKHGRSTWDSAALPFRSVLLSALLHSHALRKTGIL